MTYSRLAAPLLATFVLASPASAIPREAIGPSGPSAQALLCFYRGFDWDAREDSYEIRIHDQKVGGLPGGSFLYHVATPGKYIVFVSADINVSRSFHLLGGETYYIRIERRGYGSLSLPKLLPVGVEKGIREVRQLSYAGAQLSPIAGHYCRQNGPRFKQ